MFSLHSNVLVDNKFHISSNLIVTTPSPVRRQEIQGEDDIQCEERAQSPVQPTLRGQLGMIFNECLAT